MENEVVLYEGSQAVVKTAGMNYKLTSPMTGNQVVLQRDIDFGVLPKVKKPSLFKAGAEKIVASYGMLQRYVIESKIERVDESPLFYYLIRCDLVRVSNDGREYVFTSGFGSASTAEKRNGFNGPYDSAHTCVRMAMKRALVAAAVSISGVSAMFTSDIEDSDFVEGGYKSITNTQDPNARITSAQIKRLFAIANNAGVNANHAKERLAIMGYTKASEVTQEKYDEVCEKIGLSDEEFKESIKR